MLLTLVLLLTTLHVCSVTATNFHVCSVTAANLHVCSVTATKALYVCPHTVILCTKKKTVIFVSSGGAALAELSSTEVIQP